MIPFSRLYLILSSHTFQLFIAQHSLVQFLLHLVEEIGTAFVFPTFDVGIEAVAILRLNTEYLVENRGGLYQQRQYAAKTARPEYLVENRGELF